MTERWMALFLVIFATLSVQLNAVDGLKNCTTFGNATCDIGKYFDTTKQVCAMCKVCKVGKGVRCPCTRSSNTKCEWCSKGTFSRYENGNRFCTPCKICREYELGTRKCNKTDDAICVLKDKPKKSNDGPQAYIIIIGVMSAFLVILFGVVILLFHMYCVGNRPFHLPNLSRDGYVSNASEAQYGNCSSFSDFEDLQSKRERMNYNDSSCSSLSESRLRDRDSTQSSLLSCDNQNCSERPIHRTLENPEIRVRSLPATVYQDLGRLLNLPNLHRNWQSLAGRLGKTQLDIENLKVGGDYTERLLVDWCSGKPDANIGELYRILLEMKRNDAANVLFEYDKQQRIIHTPV